MKRLEYSYSINTDPFTKTVKGYAINDRFAVGKPYPNSEWEVTQLAAGVRCGVFNSRSSASAAVTELESAIPGIGSMSLEQVRDVPRETKMIARDIIKSHGGHP